MAKLKNHIQTFLSDYGRRRIYESEALALEASELISRLIEERHVTRSEVAAMLGTPKSNVTNLLSGARNMTMRSLADLAFVLGCRVQMQVVPLDEVDCWQQVSERDVTCLLHSVFEPVGNGGHSAPLCSLDDFPGNILVA